MTTYDELSLEDAYQIYRKEKSASWGTFVTATAKVAMNEGLAAGTPTICANCGKSPVSSGQTEFEFYNLFSLAARIGKQHGFLCFWCQNYRTGFPSGEWSE